MSNRLTQCAAEDPGFLKEYDIRRKMPIKCLWKVLAGFWHEGIQQGH